MQWQAITEALTGLEAAEGGYTLATRGIVTLANDQRVFVKIGTDPDTKQWAHKEVAVYEALTASGYAHIPTLLAHNDNRTGFALEALEKGWDWSDTWSHERMRATLTALDELAAVQVSDAIKAALGPTAITSGAEGWSKLAADPPKQEVLRAKLAAAGQEQLAGSLDIPAMASRAERFTFRDDTLVHYDVRTDNCAWHAASGTIKLIDWNWASIGDRRIDRASLLVQAHKLGLDVSPYASRLDADALHWIAGYWLNAAASPLWPGAEKSSLRDFQLQSGITALELSATL